MSVRSRFTIGISIYLTAGDTDGLNVTVHCYPVLDPTTSTTVVTDRTETSNISDVAADTPSSKIPPITSQSSKVTATVSSKPPRITENPNDMKTSGRTTDTTTSEGSEQIPRQCNFALCFVVAVVSNLVIYFLICPASSAYRSPGFKNSHIGHSLESQTGQVLDISQIAPLPPPHLCFSVYLQDDDCVDDDGGNGHHDHENYQINSKSPET